MNEINPVLKEFITKRLGSREKYLNHSSGIEEFYGMAGLDSIVFYQDFVSEFRIEIPENWNIANHITSENINIRHHLKRFLSKSYRKKTKYLDLTIDDLEEMINSKKWIDKR